MPNILLTRIDNRLIHGQVGMTWTASLGANLLVVVDDIAAKDELQQDLMSTTAESSGADVRFFDVQKMIEVIGGASEAQKIFVICRTPKVVRQLVEGGVPLDKVNVGNMHFKEGKQKLSPKVFVDDQDKEDFQYLKSKGVDVFIQDVPNDKKTAL